MFEVELGMKTVLGTLAALSAYAAAFAIANDKATDDLQALVGTWE